VLTVSCLPEGIRGADEDSAQIGVTVRRVRGMRDLRLVVQLFTYVLIVIDKEYLNAA